MTHRWLGIPQRCSDFCLTFSSIRLSNWLVQKNYASKFSKPQHWGRFRKNQEKCGPIFQNCFQMQLVKTFRLIISEITILSHTWVVDSVFYSWTRQWEPHPWMWKWFGNRVWANRVLPLCEGQCIIDTVFLISQDHTLWNAITVLSMTHGCFCHWSFCVFYRRGCGVLCFKSFRKNWRKQSRITKKIRCSLLKEKCYIASIVTKLLYMPFGFLKYKIKNVEKLMSVGGLKRLFASTLLNAAWNFLHECCDKC